MISLKWKIQLWHAAVLAAILTALGFGYYLNEHSHRLNEYDFVLNEIIHPLVHGMEHRQHGPPPGGPPPGESPPGAPTLRGNPFNQIDRGDLPGGWTGQSQLRQPNKPSADQPENRDLRAGELAEKAYAHLGFYTKVWDRHDHALLYATDGGPDLKYPAAPMEGYWTRTREGRYREMLNATPRMEIIVGFDLQTLNGELALLKWKIAGVCFLIFLVGTTVGGMLVSYSLRPLKPIYRTTADIAAGKLDSRIPATKGGNTQELTQLTHHLNECFAKLESLFGQQVQFTADASHELRNPLTALIGQIALSLKKERTPAEYRETLETCQRAADKLNRIVTDLLDLSRYDSGTCKLDCEDLPLDALVRNIADELEPHVATQGSRLKTELHGKRIYCDPFRLEQVITNLVNNALQHNPDPIEITLRTGKTADGAIIQVVDNGVGIERENLDKLFDRFFQEHTKRKNKNSHTNVGLGLAICHAIVTAHGGTLTAQSQPGLATIFTITLPLNG